MPLIAGTNTDRIAEMMHDAIALDQPLKVKRDGEASLGKVGKFNADATRQERLVKVITNTAEKEGIQSLQAFREAVVHGMNEAQGLKGEAFNRAMSRSMAFMSAIENADRSVDIGNVKSNLADKLSRAEVGTHYIPVTQEQLLRAESQISAMGDDPEIWGYNDPEKGQPPQLFEKDAGRGWAYSVKSANDPDPSHIQRSFIQNTDEVPYKGEEAFALFQDRAIEIGAKNAEERTRVAQGIASVINQAIQGSTSERFRMESLPEVLMQRDQSATQGISAYEAEITMNDKQVDIKVTTPSKLRGFIMDTMGENFIRLNEEGKIGHGLDVVTFSLDSKALLEGKVRVIPGSLRAEQSITIKNDLDLAYNMA